MKPSPACAAKAWRQMCEEKGTLSKFCRVCSGLEGVGQSCWQGVKYGHHPQCIRSCCGWQAGSSPLYPAHSASVCWLLSQQTNAIVWQVWLALVASVLAVTLAYHLLRWATPFGDFNKLRMRKTSEAPGRVRKYVVASCKRPVFLTAVHGCTMLAVHRNHDILYMQHISQCQGRSRGVHKSWQCNAGLPHRLSVKDSGQLQCSTHLGRVPA